MPLIILIASLVLAYTLRGMYRRALAQQAATDAQALAGYAMGTRYSSPAMGAAYDQSKATQRHRSETAAAGRARAKSRRAQAAVPVKVTPIRRQG